MGQSSILAASATAGLPASVALIGAGQSGRLILAQARHFAGRRTIGIVNRDSAKAATARGPLEPALETAKPRAEDIGAGTPTGTPAGTPRVIDYATRLFGFDDARLAFEATAITDATGQDRTKDRLAFGPSDHQGLAFQALRAGQTALMQG